MTLPVVPARLPVKEESMINLTLASHSGLCRTRKVFPHE